MVCDPTLFLFEFIIYSIHLKDEITKKTYQLYVNYVIATICISAMVIVGYLAVHKLSSNRNLVTRFVFTLIKISIIYFVVYLLGSDIANKPLLLILVLPINLLLPFFLESNSIENNNILPKVLVSILNVIVSMLIIFSNLTIELGILSPVFVILLPYFSMIDYGKIIYGLTSIISYFNHSNIVLMEGGQGSSSAFTPSSQSAPAGTSGGGNPPGGGNSGGPEHPPQNSRTKSKRLRDIFRTAREERGDTLRTSEIGIRNTDNQRNMGGVPRNLERTILANDVKNHHPDIWKKQQLSQLRITRGVVYKLDGIDCECPHTPLSKKG